MKKIKLSKTGWLILSAGVFVVILAGLGVTRSQQLGEQEMMTEELSLAEIKLDKLDVTDLRRQLEDLRQQVEEGEVQLEDAQERLRQTVISVDITDEFFKIAEYSGVKVMGLATSRIAPNELEGIGLSMISLSAEADGEFDKLVDFVINLNNGYATGYLKSAQLNVSGGEDLSGVDIQMIVYSYEGD